jgi:hypothetical protein
MAEQPEEQTAEQLEEQTAEQREEQTAEQPEEQTVEQPEEEVKREVPHHDQINIHLVMEDQAEDKCAEDKGGARNWNSHSPSKLKNLKSSLESLVKTLIPGGY